MNWVLHFPSHGAPDQVNFPDQERNSHQKEENMELQEKIQLLERGKATHAQELDDLRQGFNGRSDFGECANHIVYTVLELRDL